MIWHIPQGYNSAQSGATLLVFYCGLLCCDLMVIIQIVVLIGGFNIIWILFEHCFFPLNIKVTMKLGVSSLQLPAEYHHLPAHLKSQDHRLTCFFSYQNLGAIQCLINYQVYAFARQIIIALGLPSSFNFVLD